MSVSARGSQVDRRTFLKVASLATAPLVTRVASGGEGVPVPAPRSLASRSLPRLGTLKVRPAREIAASSLGVGMECLDRRMYLPEKTYGHLAALGVKWARVQTGWSRCETSQGVYDFAWLDEVVNAIRAVGVQPWFNVGYGNQLYTPDAPDVSAVGWTPTANQQAREGWVRFVSALAQHFRGRVQHWEIWNEPNIQMFWQPFSPSPEGYMDLVKLTAPAIRAGIPDAILVGGGLAGMPTDFLTGCLERGLAQEVQRVSYHPYAQIPEKGYVQKVTEWHALLACYSPSLQLWQGECGCPSSEGGVGALSNLSWNEPRQAKWLLRRTLLDLSLGLELVSYFHLVNLVRYRWKEKAEETPQGAAPRTNFRADFGLLRGDDYTPKPSYFACQRVCSLFDRATQPIGAHARLAGDQLAVPADSLTQVCFLRGKHPLFAYWWPEALQKDVAHADSGRDSPDGEGLDAAIPRARQLAVGRILSAERPTAGGELVILGIAVDRLSAVNHRRGGGDMRREFEPLCGITYPASKSLHKGSRAERGQGAQGSGWPSCPSARLTSQYPLLG